MYIRKYQITLRVHTLFQVCTRKRHNFATIQLGNCMIANYYHELMIYLIGFCSTVLIRAKASLCFASAAGVQIPISL
jgi:hypothetical protein